MLELLARFDRRDVPCWYVHLIGLERRMDPSNAMSVPLMVELHKAGLQYIADAVWRARCPSIRLVPRSFGVGELDGGSRLGGRPSMPEEVEWPQASSGPMAFVAQIDLADAARLLNPSGLPTAGRLLFFYDGAESPWGFNPSDKAFGWRVIHVADLAPCSPRAFPEALGAELRFRALPLEFRVEWTFHDGDLRDLDGYVRRSGKRGKLQQELYWEIRGEMEDADSMRHRMFGFADLVQNPMQLQAQLLSNGLCRGEASWNEAVAEQLAPGAKDWRLLLQVDSDADASMMWSDVGRLYFWMREEDMRAGNFDAVWLFLQSH